MDGIIDSKIVGDINGTLYNNPTLADGVRGKALKFNSVNQWADLGTHKYVFIKILHTVTLLWLC